jgi:hypothetical protein
LYQALVAIPKYEAFLVVQQKLWCYPRIVPCHSIGSLASGRFYWRLRQLPTMP